MRGDEEVIVREGGKYFKIPIKHLYVDTENQQTHVKETLRYPVRRYERKGREVRIEFLITHITVPINIEERHYRSLMTNKLGLNREQYNLFREVLQEKGGIQLTTRNGLIWQVKGTLNSEGQYRIDNNKTRIRNPLTNRRINLPNIYDDGRLCWGDVRNNNNHNMDTIPQMFFTFMESAFNSDLMNAARRFNQVKEWVIEQEESVRDEKESKSKQVKLLLIDKIREHSSTKNKVILLIISTIFKEDYTNIDGLV